MIINDFRTPHQKPDKEHNPFKETPYGAEENDK